MKRQFTKYSIFNLVVFLIFVLIIQIACQRTERRSDIKNSVLEASSHRNIVDSIFQADFAFLDSTLENKYATEYYPFDRLQEVTNFLVSLSGIEPTVEMSYIGWMGVNQEDVLKWKEWYNQNKHRLKWDEEKQKVVLEPDTDIYEKSEDSQKIDSIFQKHFSVLDRYLHGGEFSFDTISQATDFFESLTKIKSSADYTMFGRFQVTESEVRAWKEWYKENIDKLKWDEEQQRVIVIE